MLFRSLFHFGWMVVILPSAIRRKEARILGTRVFLTSGVQIVDNVFITGYDSMTLLRIHVVVVLMIAK